MSQTLSSKRNGASFANSIFKITTSDYKTSGVNGASKVVPVTVRTLESMIRLATAHAKCRLSDLVTIEDCKVALELLEHTLFKNEEESLYSNNSNHQQLIQRRGYYQQSGKYHRGR